MTQHRAKVPQPIKLTSFERFSSPLVRMPSFKANVKELKDTARRASKENRTKINDIIRLYEEKRIRNFLTAENAINRLAIQTKSKARNQRAQADYEKIMAKYGEAEPMTGRLARESQAKAMKTIGQEKTYSVTMILFRKAEDQEEKQTEAQNMTINVSAATKEETASVKKQVKKRTFADLVQFYVGTFDVSLDNVDHLYLQSDEDMLLRRGEGKRGGDKKGTKKVNKTTAADFAKVAKLLASKNVIFSNLMDMSGNSYLEAIYLMNIFTSDTEGKAFEPKTKKNRDTEKIAAFHRFTTTELDLEASTFKEAIAKKNYVKDECFLNSIYDFYRNNLLRTDKTRNVITRASILQTIRKTEDNVKEGLSIQDVLPFFEKYRLQLRVFNKFCKIEFKYDPPNRNHHNKAMYCMMSDGHIYTLNYDIKKLEQTIDDDDGDDDMKPKVGESYVIREDAKATPAKMFKDINDINQIVAEMGPTEYDDNGKPITRILKLIHQDDDLMEILNDLIEAGYYPGISFDAGRVTALKITVNYIFCIIEVQQLIKSAIDGVVIVDGEETYNNMNQAMTALTSKLFLKSHLSYYTEQDLDILDSYRTKPICGNLRAHQPKDKLIEIDVSKAYTASFCDISEIPLFNEFDNFKPYQGETVLPLNLYVVKDFKHPLATQSHSLVYGKFLQKDMQITAFKQPSFIKQVDYKKLIDELYDTKISNDSTQDTYIKKLIANVNIGLLEKSFNRKSVGDIFQDLAECKFYQAQYGGVIHSIQQIEHVKTIHEASPDGLDDGVEPCGDVVDIKFATQGDPYHVLVIKNERQLKNGFRYIKELLLQSHNFKLMQAYDALTEANVKITSVKTDCFTIPAECEQVARQLLSFDQGSRTWRVSKTEGIIFPFEN